MERRSFAGTLVHEGDHFEYVVECEINRSGMTWFATVFRGGEIRGHPNGILDGVDIEQPDLSDLLNDIVAKSIRDRVGVLCSIPIEFQTGGTVCAQRTLRVRRVRYLAQLGWIEYAPPRVSALSSGGAATESSLMPLG